MSKLLIGAIAAVVVIGGVGWVARGVGQRGAEEAIEAQLEQAAGGNAEVRINNGNVSVTSSAGSATVGAGGNVSLPAGFPSDVPTPTGGTLTTAYGGNESGKTSYALIYTVSGGAAAKAATTYQNQLASAGFAIQASGAYAAVGNVVSGFTATKGNWQVAVAVTTTGETTTLTLTVTDEAVTNMGY